MNVRGEVFRVYGHTSLSCNTTMENQMDKIMKSEMETAGLSGDTGA